MNWKARRSRKRRHSDRRGFALPLVFLVIGFLTVSLTASFALMSGERRTNANTAAQVDAFAFAQAGLDQYLANRNGLGFTASPPASTETIRIAFPGGYADVTSRLIQPLTDRTAALYAVQSTGTDTSGRLAGTPMARRTVAQYAYWQNKPIEVLAGWTSITGLQKNGGAGTLSGADACGQEPDVAGVAVPGAPGYNQEGGDPVPSGTPPILELGTNPIAAAARINIDWDAIVNQGAVTPDISIPGDAWPDFSNAEYWPVIIVLGDFSLPTTGRGTLLVTGALTISGSKTWRGVVLVGNTLTSNGNNTVEGATISGLNVKLGQNPGMSDVGDGTKTYVYHSCNVASAMANIAVLYPMPNAWMDNWASY
jgi:hypothetical protein